MCMATQRVPGRQVPPPRVHTRRKSFLRVGLLGVANGRTSELVPCEATGDGLISCLPKRSKTSRHGGGRFFQICRLLS